MPVKAHVKGKRKAPPPPLLRQPPPSSSSSSSSSLPLPSPPSLLSVSAKASSLLLLPNALDGRNSIEQPAINQCDVKLPNHKTGTAPNHPITCVPCQKRKKSAAPLPPKRNAMAASAAPATVKKCATTTDASEMNNLSAISRYRTSDKSPVNAINLNIFEPNHHRRNDLQCTAKETNEVNVNLDSNGKHNLLDLAEFRSKPLPLVLPSSISSLSSTSLAASSQAVTDQIWICNYCTVENPFWKIICNACERIKPYNTPTITPSNVNRSFSPQIMMGRNDSAPFHDNKHLMSSVQRRPKINKWIHNGNDDKILNRNSMLVDMKNASSSTSKQLPNKRSSLCLIKYGDQNVTPEVLEMERERIRNLIRAMHNRALNGAHQYPGNVDKKKLSVETKKIMEKPIKIATINKPGKRNGFAKYDIEKDYNLPSIRRNVDDSRVPAEHTAKATTTTAIAPFPKECDSKRNPHGLNAIKRIENGNNIVNRNELADVNQTYCDQLSPEKKQSNFALNADRMDVKLGKSPIASVTVVKTTIKSGIDDISLNVYINFNNAIDVKVPRDMTLAEFKQHIFTKFLPCTNVKIYFNGLLLRDDDQTLVECGITNQSSLYINTENIVVQSPAKNEKKSVVVQTQDSGPSKNTTIEKAFPNKLTKKADERTTTTTTTATTTAAAETKTTNKSLFDDAVKKNADGEKFLIEHVQLNRYTIERVPPDVNINKVKYRGVYNYNPRCNPDISKILNNTRNNNNNNNINRTAAAVAENALRKPFSMTKPVNVKSVSDAVSNPVLDVANSEPLTQYIQLLTLDDSMDLTKNTDAFECSVCLVEYQPYEGIILRNCLHTFCMDCVRNTITYSDEAEVKCPYMDEKYSCDCLLQDREIKALLSKSEYDEHLAKSLRIAEHQIENSFHCKTPDCKGWCIYEDDVNIFKCPICRLENCLTCRVIHDGLNCKQYQNMMKNNLNNNPENATTHAMLDEMIKNGEAMNCPACKIVLMKKWGCDWLKCSMCKTEICWITRGYRWGPAGKGDTSAGCKCGVDGFKCHPKCNYCH